MAEKKEKDHLFAKEMLYILSVGFYGGLFTSFLAYLAYLINFVPFGPGVLLQLFSIRLSPGIEGMVGHMLSILLISLVSIGSSYLYFMLFRHLESIWIGVLYGLAWWAVIFFGLNSLIPGVQSVRQLGLTTNTVFLSLFILYGLFIGYSISFNHKEMELERKR